MAIVIDIETDTDTLILIHHTYIYGMYATHTHRMMNIEDANFNHFHGVCVCVYDASQAEQTAA